MGLAEVRVCKGLCHHVIPCRSGTRKNDRLAIKMPSASQVRCDLNSVIQEGTDPGLVAEDALEQLHADQRNMLPELRLRFEEPIQLFPVTDACTPALCAHFKQDVQPLVARTEEASQLFYMFTRIDQSEKLERRILQQT